jgi:hypothetical protein
VLRYLQREGVQFDDTGGVRLDHAVTLKAQVSNEIDREVRQ